MNGLCSHERLELALAGTLQADEELTLHLHLEDCELCAAEMERLAGGEQASREIAALLVPDELDTALPLRDECSTADFVVDHLEPSDDPAVLGRLGGYEVHDIIGRGGMGVVLKGFDRELKRFVAIKALAPHLAHNALARKRFAREAQAAAAVVNLHVIAIHQVQPNGQLPFLVMPLLTGESLAHRIKTRGTLELNEILRIGMQAAEGLAAAHGQGLIHRDVKPSNILLEKGVERAVLTDFGLARAADDVSMTRQGVVAGTPEYMSPEQARGQPLDGRSDLFSLGCVLYEMATGVSPFRTDSTVATLRRIVDEQPAAMASLVPELPPWFCNIVERLLSKDSAQRFSSASEVSQLLEECLSHLQQPASVPLPACLVPHAKGSGSMFISPRKGVITMLGTIGMTLLGLVLWQATDAPDISGQWTSDEWGTVILAAKQSGQYEGTFTGPDANKPTIDTPDTVPIKWSTLGTQRLFAESTPGSVQLKWSRVERRFNGTWRAGDDRKGRLSLRLVGNEIRGALTTARNAEKESDSPRLADFEWKRSRHAHEDRVTPQALPGSPPGIVADESLDGVWEEVLSPDIAAKQPEDQRTRLVFDGNWHAAFRGSQRLWASRLKLEPLHTPRRIAFVELEQGPHRRIYDIKGIYEVQQDCLRLSVVPDSDSPPIKVDADPSEFTRVQGKLAEEQLVALRLYSTKSATTGKPTPNAATGEAAKIDKSTLPKVSSTFEHKTTVLNGLVSGGGIIERIEGETIHFTSGDRIVVPAGTMLLLLKRGDRPVEQHKVDSLEPGMAIAYSIRDGRIEKLVLTGIVEKVANGASVFDKIKELDLRKGNETTTSIDGRVPLRLTGIDGEVAVKIGETRLIKLAEPTESIEWRHGEFKPEGIDDIEPFDYVLVQWRANGRITFTCYASPPPETPNGA